MTEDTQAYANTDRELYRREGNDPMDLDNYYQPSIHVTARGEIGIKVKGHVYVASIETWFDAMKAYKE